MKPDTSFELSSSGFRIFRRWGTVGFAVMVLAKLTPSTVKIHSGDARHGIALCTLEGHLNRKSTTLHFQSDLPRFCKEPYTRGDRGGGGIARVLRNGNVFEKAGVNLSVARLCDDFDS